MVLLMFWQAVYFGHFLSFYTLVLEPPKVEQRVQGPAPPRAPDVGVVRLVPPSVRVVARVVRRGDVVGGEEGVNTVDQPGVGWCVVVGGGEGVVSVVHEGHVRGGGWLLVVGVGMKLFREVTRSTHVLLSHAMVSVWVVLGRGWAMLGSW